MSRTLRYDERDAVLTIDQGKKTQRYWLTVNSQEDFTLRKWMAPESDQPGELYTINTRRKTCTCKGNTYHGHCKHVDAVRKLIELQLLEVIG